ncbi:MAG: hypothetical protein RR256_04660, partial [Bacteroidales bacterium]
EKRAAVAEQKTQQLVAVQQQTQTSTQDVAQRTAALEKKSDLILKCWISFVLFYLFIILFIIFNYLLLR